MKSKSLLGWGLASGAVALAAILLGYLFYWPVNGSNWGASGYGGSGGYSSGGGMMGGGMMGGGSGGMMGGGSGMMGGGMMGMMGGPTDASTAPLTVDQAADAARRYVDYWDNSDLKVKEVMEFANHFYAIVVEQSTGAGAFEVIVDRNTGVVSPEMGPNMMWNTRYGTMGTYDDTGESGYNTPGGMMGGGMMGRYGRDRAVTTTDMPVKKDDARNRAQQFLDRQLPGARVHEPATFYGYYTLDVEKDGRILGMLSVHGYYGQVWYHSWHGAFLSEKEF